MYDGQYMTNITTLINKDFIYIKSFLLICSCLMIQTCYEENHIGKIDESMKHNPIFDPKYMQYKKFL